MGPLAVPVGGGKSNTGKPENEFEIFTTFEGLATTMLRLSLQKIAKGIIICLAPRCTFIKRLFHEMLGSTYCKKGIPRILGIEASTTSKSYETCNNPKSTIHEILPTTANLLPSANCTYYYTR
jgi:hypothetical protein